MKQTCRMSSFESFSLNWCIRLECHIHPVGWCEKRMGQFWSTEPSESWRVSSRSVIHNDMIISTLLMGFQFKLCKDKFDPMTGSCGKKPGAVFSGWIWLRPVGAGNFSRWSVHMMSAGAFFTVVAILVQNVSIMTGTGVGANGVFANMLTSAVVYCTFVFICFTDDTSQPDLSSGDIPLRAPKLL